MQRNREIITNSANVTIHRMLATVNCCPIRWSFPDNDNCLDSFGVVLTWARDVRRFSSNDYDRCALERCWKIIIVAMHVNTSVTSVLCLRTSHSMQHWHFAIATTNVIVARIVNKSGQIIFLLVTRETNGSPLLHLLRFVSMNRKRIWIMWPTRIDSSDTTMGNENIFSSFGRAEKKKSNCKTIESKSSEHRWASLENSEANRRCELICKQKFQNRIKKG